MTTFDQILPTAARVLQNSSGLLAELDWLLINRDLNGRVRFIVSDRIEGEKRVRVEDLYRTLAENIEPHGYPVECGILYEQDIDQACQGAIRFALEDFDKVWVVDRLASESRWVPIKSVSKGVPRIVFFSIKGGVGRSTALAASAWHLARLGKKVLVLDLDLESPGLSSALLPDERQPKYGITDWLVEDLVDNGEGLIDDLFAMSDLPMDGSIHIVPSHGHDPGEYVSKLGRVWMPKMKNPLQPEVWSSRLNRLIGALEARLHPEIVLIDSRAGIDEVAAACVTDLGAHTIMLFAIQGQQTWTGYRSLFAHWQRHGVITKIRERLQMVAGLVPDDERRADYLARLRKDAYDLFEATYDETGPGETGAWNYESDDEYAPHMPLPIRWNRGWYGLMSLHGRMAQLDEDEVRLVYGPLLEFLERTFPEKNLE